MIRISCSYWVNVEGPKATIRALHSALECEGIVPDILDGTPGLDSDGKFSASYELADIIGGSMDQWTDVGSTFKRLSKEFPEAVINLKEICEERYTPSVYTTFQNGTATSKYGRRLEPDQLDIQTINACTDLLRTQGLYEIADMVEKGLKDKKG